MSISQHFIQQCSAFQSASALSDREVKRWVIALSGGLDSMVLLDLAHRLLPAKSVVAVHVNHQQQATAKQWQIFCALQCAQRNIAYFPFVTSPKSSSEQALRDARYACFGEFLQINDCLLLGHHAIDQAETVLFRLVRGAGSKGLAAMPVSRELFAGQLFRPLLTVAKKELQAHAKKSLEWVEDPSNQSLAYDRNYIRHKVIPPLLERWPKAGEQIALSAQLLAQEHRVLQDYLAEDVGKLSSTCRFDLQKWSCYSEAKALLLLKFWLTKHTQCSVSRKQLQRVVGEVIHSRVGSKGFCQLGDYRAMRYRDQLHLIDQTIIVQPWPILEIAAQDYSLTHGILSFAVTDLGIVWREGMYLQSRRAGMSITVLGGVKKKLKNIFQEHNIAPWLRDKWPILMYGEQIVAIPGICISDDWLYKTEKKSLIQPQWQPL